VIVYLLVCCLKNPSFTKCILLGLVIGPANLNHASSLLFGPLSVSIVLLMNGVRKAKAWKFSFSMVVTILAVLSPWILRNYLVFDAFVPVQGGFGYQLYIGNPSAVSRDIFG
jgi:phosphoglycerol transferase MdoB-like AlkP superfamily enzyme